MAYRGPEGRQKMILIYSNSGQLILNIPVRTHNKWLYIRTILTTKWAVGQRVDPWSRLE